ncbi:uncharacterized protein JCM6883_000219 [Sporobolomyces salmoneus]|uniref:uncharacterized protein n=1 Tax=Sporobolomyces salmoneus TaxID=183962 RepID=UPI003172E670
MAGAVIPLLAQQFVDSRSSSSFDLVVTNQNNNNSNSPRQALQQRQLVDTSSPASKEKEKGKKGPSPRRRREEGDESKEIEARARREAMERGAAEGIFYWSDHVLKEKFMFVKEVGFGNWGSLWLSYVEPERERVAALKMVHRLKDTTSAARVRALWNEYKCVGALSRSTSHPNLIAFHAFILTPSYSVVCMDYHPALISVSIPESRAKKYARSLLSAVEHLHVHGITHNDIKPSNILLAADDRPVLIDFGFAQQWDTRSPDRYLSSLSWGTVEYLSPERARGYLHDERLSDVWALGITMYELVVGRTPFEETEEETFLDRSQLEVYYQRTLTGRFYGDYIISRDLESLVRLMVEVDPSLRLQSCGRALQHRYFQEASPRPKTNSPLGNSATPPRQIEVIPNVKPKTPTSSAKKPQRSTPKKKEEKSFIIFSDENAPSPARTGESPRSQPLMDRTNDSPSLFKSTPPRSKATSPLSNKTPTRSRIPIRKVTVPSPATKALIVKPQNEEKQFIADDTVPVPPLLTSPPTQSVRISPEPEAATEGISEDKPLNETPSDLNRSTSVTSVRRKPVPTLFDESFDLADRSLASSKAPSIKEEEEVLSSNRTSPIIFEGPELSKSSDSISSKTSRFLKRSFSTRSSSLNRSTSSIPTTTTEVASSKSSVSPLQRQLSKSVTGRIRKLSIPLQNVQRPSIATLSGLKQSISALTKRRGSTESNFSFIEADPIRHSSATPVRARGPASVDPAAQRIRLETFSAHVQHILEVRNSLDVTKNTPAKVSDDKGVASESKIATPRKLSTSPANTSPGSIHETTPRKTKQASPRRSPKRSPRRSPALKATVSKTPSPPNAQGFKPGHRRIPTAIRNVPSVVLHESGDDADLEIESEGSTAETSSSRIASPPPPPRVVEPPRQLPTWVADDSDEEEDQDADVDEPTITIGMTPRTGRPSKVSVLGGGKASHGSRTAEIPRVPLKSAREVSLDEQRVSTPAKLLNYLPDTVSNRSSTSTRAPTDLPFQNLDSRSDSRASTTRSTHLGGHARSRSVLSFFTRSTSSLAMSVSSETEEEEWTTHTKVEIGGQGNKKRKLEKIRRVVSKVFR